ncbi:hypothetical protein [Sphingobacterium bambusae]|uniref:Uncharacterized protein n=1 Tax=Sphingobacterium bambusae TaxID=662858 RepID=A0ABW6B948_9SPHI|nr:hypothetical protein [Sphingobacterium bambusae]WPL49126.1 hypothetical protein SCB77_01435 [Sphingobacterium bambusae]
MARQTIKREVATDRLQGSRLGKGYLNAQYLLSYGATLLRQIPGVQLVYIAHDIKLIEDIPSANTEAISKSQSLELEKSKSASFSSIPDGSLSSLLYDFL